MQVCTYLSRWYSTIEGRKCNASRYTHYFPIQNGELFALTYGSLVCALSLLLFLFLPFVPPYSYMLVALFDLSTDHVAQLIFRIGGAAHQRLWIGWGREQATREDVRLAPFFSYVLNMHRRTHILYTYIHTPTRLNFMPCSPQGVQHRAAARGRLPCPQCCGQMYQLCRHDWCGSQGNFALRVVDRILMGLYIRKSHRCYTFV